MSLLPRDPAADEIDNAEFSYERKAREQYAYTDVVAETLVCPDCGNSTLRRENWVLRDTEGEAEPLGTIEACSTCHPESLLFGSHMPRVVAGRSMRARAVL
jgi:hypothetical protein